MKKKLLALAVAGAFAVPVAAMADVTIYGVMDASIDQTSSGNATVGGNSVSTTKVSSSQSRIGFKGAEDVGGGTSAVFQIEQGINSDDGAWGSPARNTFVGLSGESWGAVLLGRNDSPYKTSTRKMDVFADTIADNRNLMGTGRIQFDGRNSNTVTYNSPNMGGIGLSAQYIAGAENVTNNSQNKGSAYSLAGTYAAGPITAALAYEVHDFGDGAIAATATTPAIPTTGSLGALNAGDANKKERATKLAAGYAVDQFAVNLVFERTTDDMGVGSKDHKAYYIGGKYNVTGSDAVKLAYTHVGNVGSPAVDQTGSKQISVGYDHGLSKRTTVYALWTRLTNENAAIAALGTSSTGVINNVGAGADPTAVSIGIKHAF